MSSYAIFVVGVICGVFLTVIVYENMLYHDEKKKKWRW